MTIKAMVQRLFGRTVIDALGLKKNAWYIDEEQVTADAATLNGSYIPSGQYVTPALLGPGVAVGGLTGGDGSVVAFDPYSVHFMIVPGTNGTAPVSVPGMSSGDKIVMIVRYVWGTGWWGYTDYFQCGTNQLIKVISSNDVGYMYWIVWADCT